METCYLQIVEHLAEFMVCDAVDHFGIHYNFSCYDQVRNVLTYRHSFVGHIETGLLLTGRIAIPQLNHKCVLVGSFKQAMSQGIENFLCRADNGLGNASTPQSVSIRVHLWFVIPHS